MDPNFNDLSTQWGALILLPPWSNSINYALKGNKVQILCNFIGTWRILGSRQVCQYQFQTLQPMSHVWNVCQRQNDSFVDKIHFWFVEHISNTGVSRLHRSESYIFCSQPHTARNCVSNTTWLPLHGVIRICTIAFSGRCIQWTICNIPTLFQSFHTWF